MAIPFFAIQVKALTLKIALGWTGEHPKLIQWIVRLRARVEEVKKSVSQIHKLVVEDILWGLSAAWHNWEKHLGTNIPREKWEQIYSHHLGFAKSSKFYIFAWKCLHRYFYTPNRLAMMFLGHPPHNRIWLRPLASAEGLPIQRKPNLP